MGATCYRLDVRRPDTACVQFEARRCALLVYRCNQHQPMQSPAGKRLRRSSSAHIERERERGGWHPGSDRSGRDAGNNAAGLHSVRLLLNYSHTSNDQMSMRCIVGVVCCCCCCCYCCCLDRWHCIECQPSSIGALLCWRAYAMQRPTAAVACQAACASCATPMHQRWEPLRPCTPAS